MAHERYVPTIIAPYVGVKSRMIGFSMAADMMPEQLWVTEEGKPGS